MANGERQSSHTAPTGTASQESVQLAEEYRRLTEAVLDQMGIGGRSYQLGLISSGVLMLLGAAAWAWQLWQGIGVTGIQHPIMWATYITSFVWWIGVAHSGTLISAVMYLLRTPYRAAFSRAAEAMTLTAVIIALTYPILHLGVAWRFYWLIPYPNQRGLWVTFRSPLILDVFAMVTYLSVTVLFFWLGLLPDLAIIRDRSKGWRRTIYGVLSLGWEGSGRQWKHYGLAYTLLAGLIAPLFVSGHSVGSWDFALGIVPGWHSLIFPVYFIIGAVLSGLGMMLVLMIPLRSWLRLSMYITLERLEQLARLILTTSLLLSFAYAVEYFTIWLSQNKIEQINLLYKMAGPFAPMFWVMTFCNSVLPLVFFWRGGRRRLWVLFAVGILVNVGMWLERFLIVAASLGRDYLPYAWQDGGYRFSLIERGVFLGTVGWFCFSYLLIVRYFPMLSIADIKREILREFREEAVVLAGEAETA